MARTNDEHAKRARERLNRLHDQIDILEREAKDLVVTVGALRQRAVNIEHELDEHERGIW